MKNTFSKFFLVLLLPVLFISCSKDGDANNPIVGTYKATKFSVKEGNAAEVDYLLLVSAFEPCFKNIEYTFSSDLKTSSKIPTGCDITSDDTLLSNGTYKVDATTISLNSPDGDLSGTYTYASKVLTIKIKDGTDNVTMEFTKL